MKIEPNYLHLTVVIIILFIGWVVFPICLLISAWKLDKLQKRDPKKYKKILDDNLGSCTKGWFQRFHDEHGYYPPSGGGGE